MPKKIAVVTGASSGLGREFVKLLSEKTSIEEIWVLARTRSKLEALAAEFPKEIRVFAMDLSDSAEILRFAAVLEEEKPEILYLINNAGFAKFCSYQDLSIQESLNMVNLNCNGVLAMGLVCIPYMIQGSHILNIASQASFQPLPYMNIYSASKAFVRNYSRALHVELQSAGISVTAVCPGWMRTAFFDRAMIGAKKGISKFYGMVTPAVVAAKALRDAEKGKDISVYGVYVKLCHLVAKLLPQRAMMDLWLMQQGMYF